MNPQEVVAHWVQDAGVEHEQTGDSFAIVLPGENRLRTTCSIRVGTHSVSVNAFVCRRPDDDEGRVHRWLLERNRRLYGIAYALDPLGDIYLVGRLPLAAVTTQEIDQLIGCVLAEADGSFNTILELGFRESIEKEWRWRLSHGESTANLAAFEHLRPEGD